MPLNPNQQAVVNQLHSCRDTLQAAKAAVDNAKAALAGMNAPQSQQVVTQISADVDAHLQRLLDESATYDEASSV